MKALICGEKPDHLHDCLGFIDLLKELLGGEYEVYAVVSEKPEELSKIEIKGVKKIFAVGEVNSRQYLSALEKLYSELQAEIIVGVSVKNMIEVISRLSSKKDVPMLTEVVEVAASNGDIILKRNMLGGRALVSYRFKTPIMLTVPQKKFKPSMEGPIPEIVEYKAEEETKIITVELKPKEKGAIDIEAAEIVVGVGRGFRNKDDLNLAFELAKLIGGEVGCTRPIAADYGWLGEDRWIGISGKKIRGKLYFAVGLSGAPQHIMAANDSKIIVAINKDKNAPIFQYADYGVVADLYQFLPVLIKCIKKYQKTM